MGITFRALGSINISFGELSGLATIHRRSERHRTRFAPHDNAIRGIPRRAITVMTSRHQCENAWEPVIKIEPGLGGSLRTFLANALRRSLTEVKRIGIRVA